MVNKNWSFLTFALAVLPWWSVLAMADFNCYNPDGTQAVDDVPCTPDATTFCCNKGDVCMSNGLCYLQGKRGFALSRASCTDRSWDLCGSYTYCMPYNKKSGFPIVAAQYNGSKTSYCCGTASWNNQTNKIDCGNFESVSIPSGTAIPGVAGLSVKSPATESATNTTTPGSSNGGSSSNTSREAAIGAGVGVPLGVIAVASIIWALWERRTRLKAISTPLPMPVAESAVGTFHQPGTPQRFVELGAAHVSEIATSDRPKSHTESQ